MKTPMQRKLEKLHWREKETLSQVDLTVTERGTDP
jgi:hypothetical protein